MKKDNKNIEIYQAKDGAIEISIDPKKETIWANQSDLCRLFKKDQSVISRHINKIFRDKEIEKKSNMQKMHIANSDKPVSFYSLDVILAVGYRTNSKEAVDFRKWATKILKEYLTSGFVVNKKQIASNLDHFLLAVESIKQLSQNKNLVGSDEVLELVKTFANTWMSLDAYDKAGLPTKGYSKQKVEFIGGELVDAVKRFKQELENEGEATDLFAQEKNKGDFEGIIGNVFQSFAGKELYPTIEAKAAHLLYFVVKNHVFNDGNKRVGAFSFIWFLKKVELLDHTKINPSALTALTLLIAESNPKEKEKMIGLVILLLKR